MPDVRCSPEIGIVRSFLGVLAGRIQRRAGRPLQARDVRPEAGEAEDRLPDERPAFAGNGRRAPRRALSKLRIWSMEEPVGARGLGGLASPPFFLAPVNSAVGKSAGTVRSGMSSAPVADRQVFAIEQGGVRPTGRQQEPDHPSPFAPRLSIAEVHPVISGRPSDTRHARSKKLGDVEPAGTSRQRPAGSSSGI